MNDGKKPATNFFFVFITQNTSTNVDYGNNNTKKKKKTPNDHIAFVCARATVWVSKLKVITIGYKLSFWANNVLVLPLLIRVKAECLSLNATDTIHTHTHT